MKRVNSVVRVGIVGLGKMGISHCSIVNAHPSAKVVAVCDTSGMVLEAFKKHTQMKTFTDYKSMLNAELDCVFIATPTRFHADMVEQALSKGIHVFCEKPFVLEQRHGERLVEQVRQRGLANQVGYHNRFIATFRKVKELVARGVIGDVYHFVGESHGPVVTRRKGGTWRAQKSEGGGCLYDYASHVINLVHYIFGEPSHVRGTMLKSIHSRDVEDAVYSAMHLKGGLSGILSVNWSDDSYRKMTVQVLAFGTKGKIISDAQELKVYIREDVAEEQLRKGWNTRYITDFPGEIPFYLRGEEYTLQVDHFLKKVIGKEVDNVNSFESAMVTDRVIHMLKEDAA